MRGRSSAPTAGSAAAAAGASSEDELLLAAALSEELLVVELEAVAGVEEMPADLRMASAVGRELLA
jgi:hypothetical protein